MEREDLRQAAVELNIARAFHGAGSTIAKATDWKRRTEVGHRCSISIVTGACIARLARLPGGPARTGKSHWVEPVRTALVCGLHACARYAIRVLRSIGRDPPRQRCFEPRTGTGWVGFSTGKRWGKIHARLPGKDVAQLPPANDRI